MHLQILKPFVPRYLISHKTPWLFPTFEVSENHVSSSLCRPHSSASHNIADKVGPVVKCDARRKRTRHDTKTADAQVIVTGPLHAGYTDTQEVQIYRQADKILIHILQQPITHQLHYNPNSTFQSNTQRSLQQCKSIHHIWHINIAPITTVHYSLSIRYLLSAFQCNYYVIFPRNSSCYSVNKVNISRP